MKKSIDDKILTKTDKLIEQDRKEQMAKWREVNKKNGKKSKKSRK